MQKNKIEWSITQEKLKHSRNTLTCFILRLKTLKKTMLISTMKKASLYSSHPIIIINEANNIMAESKLCNSFFSHTKTQVLRKDAGISHT